MKKIDNKQIGLIVFSTTIGVIVANARGNLTLKNILVALLSIVIVLFIIGFFYHILVIRKKTQ